LGGTGRDKLFGEAGDDVLIGNQGNDHLSGGSGRDTLDGGQNNDFLHGGDDADTFFFAKGDGKDTIDDFHPNQDVIDIGRGATGFAQLLLKADGHDTVVTFANVSITLTNVNLADLSAADFHFNADLSYIQFDDLADLFNFKA
jgi:Ca2+-binding RTX toxin-like protein